MDRYRVAITNWYKAPRVISDWETYEDALDELKRCWHIDFDRAYDSTEFANDAGVKYRMDDGRILTPDEYDREFKERGEMGGFDVIFPDGFDRYDVDGKSYIIIDSEEE